MFRSNFSAFYFLLCASLAITNGLAQNDDAEGEIAIRERVLEDCCAEGHGDLKTASIHRDGESITGQQCSFGSQNSGYNSDAIPELDIKCNGHDEHVVVPHNQNTKLTIALDAHNYAGTPVDLWCVVEVSGGGTYCYNGASWFSGVNHAYYTGPLANVNETILDMLLPLGGYIAYLALDTIPNGVLDMAAIAIYDSVDFEVLTYAGFFEDFEDNLADDWMPDGPHWSVVGGVYYLDCPYFDYFNSYYEKFDYGDFVYSVDLRMLDTGFTGPYDYGVFFRGIVPPSPLDRQPPEPYIDNSYELTADVTGNYKCYINIQGSPTIIVSGHSVNWIDGAGNWNTLQVEATGTAFAVFVNGVLETTFTDSTYSAGKVGLVGQGSGGYDQDYEFDNVTLTLPP